MQALSESYSLREFASGKTKVFWSRRFVNALFFALGDLLALSAAVTLAAWLQVWLPGADVSPNWLWFLLGLWLIGAFFMRLLPSWGLGAPTELKRITELMLAVFGGTAAVSVFLIHRQAVGDAIVLSLGVLFAWPLVLLGRQAVRRLLMRARLWGLPTVVYGGAATGRLLIQALRENPDYGYVPVGIFDDAPSLKGESIHGVPVLGPSSHVVQHAPVAVLAMPGIGRERTVALLEGPLSIYRTVIIIPDLFEVESLWVKACDFSGVLGLEVTRNLLDPVATLAKRTFDLVAVLLTLPVWLPICGLLALAIWFEDRAHPLFFQRRVGVGGAQFTTWKFRTMTPNAEEVLRRTLETNAELRAEWEANYKLRRDPRITRIGALLRKTSLDELPQLVNVLLGQMSLVGPRPLPPYHLRQLPEQVQFLRERVRPGMTGLWQVSGRSEAGNAGMERWDPYYVRNWSMWLDVVVLLRTVQIVLKGSGAY